MMQQALKLAKHTLECRQGLAVEDRREVGFVKKQPALMAPPAQAQLSAG